MQLLTIMGQSQGLKLHDVLRNVHTQSLSTFKSKLMES